MFNFKLFDNIQIERNEVRPMIYTQYGRTGLKVSRLGLGCIRSKSGI
jgi:Predicted oxidoreductases (related to aryl-alcohol dehydrogenases)